MTVHRIIAFNLLLTAAAWALLPVRVGAFSVEEASITDIQDAHRDGRVTAHQVVAAYLARIAADDKDGPDINSLITLNPEALSEGDRIDAAYRATGRFPGPLHGIPVVIRDNIDVAGMTMTSGFQGRKHLRPPTDAPLAHQIRQVGAIIIAEASLAEFAKGGGYIKGLPVGLQIRGRAWDEARLIEYAYAYGQATHYRLPPPTVPPLTPPVQ